MQFQVLGPIAVSDGETGLEVGGPQQRLVLALLLMYANGSVSTDRIIDGLWEDEPPPTARKTIQGYISSLRRALGDDAIITTATGYRLEVKRHDVDALNFEDQLAEARQMADPSTRRFALRDALDAWQGAPYDDVADCDALRPEIARLNELKLVATAEQLAADIDVGPPAAAIPQLEALVRRHPLQERFRALLMVALYRSGRQTDALRVFEDARRYLAAEVGLDPGPELRALEQRILEQDPTLEGMQPLASTGAPRANIANPYRGLRPFDEESGASFHGRDALVRRLRENLDRVGVPRLVVVSGASGSGKSSVVRAGLIPRLRAEGWTTVTITPGADPPAELVAAIEIGSDLVVIDQFETGLADASTVNDLLALIASAVQVEQGPWIVLTLRADYLDILLAHAGVGPWVERALVLVPPMAEHEVAAAIEKPAAAAGVAATTGIAEVMFQDMAGRGGSLPLMQYALTEMFDRRSSDVLTLDDYHRVHGLGGALAGRAEEVYVALPRESQTGLREALLQLIRLGDDGDPALHRMPRDAFSADQLAGLDRFGEHRMVTFDRRPEPTVEISHLALLGEWPRLSSWVDEARDELVARRRLRSAAIEWDEAGREHDLLFGAGAAASYVDAAAPPAESIEAAFLAASNKRNEADQRKKRRNRMIVGSALGIAAAISLLLAVTADQRRRDAESARQDAEIRALATAAVLQSQNDTELGLLLAIEAYRADPTPGGLAPLVTALGEVTGRSELFTASAIHSGKVTAGFVLFGPEAAGSFSINCARQLGPGKFVAGEPEFGHTAVFSDVGAGKVVAVRQPQQMCQVSLNESAGLAVGSDNEGAAQIYDFEKGETVVAIDGAVTHARWLPNDRILGFTAGSDPGGIDFGDVAEKVRLAWVDVATGEATITDRTAVTFSADPTGDKILITDRAGPVADGIPVGSDALVQKLIVAADSLEVLVDLGEVERSNSRARWSRDGTLVGDISRSGRLRIWDAITGEPTVDLPVIGTSLDEAAWVEFAPSNDVIAVVRQLGEISLHQLSAEAPEIGRVGSATSSVAESSFIDDERLAVMRDSGAVEVFDFSSSPFIDTVINCCGSERLTFFTADGGSGLARSRDGSLQVIELPTGDVTPQTVAEDIAGIWIRDDGSQVLITPRLEFIDGDDPTYRRSPLGTEVATESAGGMTQTDSPDVVNTWVLTSGTATTPTGIVLGRVDINTFEAVEGPHDLALSGTKQFIQEVGDRVLVQDLMGTILQFGFDGEPISPSMNLPFVANGASGLPGTPLALLHGSRNMALIDLDTGELISTVETEFPAPATLLPDGLAAVGRQGIGLDLWSTNPFIRLGTIATADSEGLVQITSVDGSGNLWYSSGERYLLIPIDPTAWLDKACRLAASTLTKADWIRFVSSTRPYDPAC